MGLFDVFRKSPKERRAEEAHRRAMQEDLEVYSGMRVEVTSGDGKIFLVAKLLELRGDRAQLEPGADGSLMAWLDESVKVTLRGYSSIENRAVVMEGTVRVTPSKKVWQVEQLSLVDRAENRAHIRVETSLEGTFTLADRPSVPAEKGQIRNIGLGGVCLGAQARRDVGDKLLLRVENILELDGIVLPCQVLRIDMRKSGYFEYGCRFLDLEEDTERRLFRAIYALYHGLY